MIYNITNCINVMKMLVLYFKTCFNYIVQQIDTNNTKKIKVSCNYIAEVIFMDKNILFVQLSNENLDVLEKRIVQQIERVLFEKSIETQSVKVYMNKKEACEYIGVSFNTLKKFIDEGLRVVEVAGIEMIRKVDVDEFFEKHTA